MGYGLWVMSYEFELWGIVLLEIHFLKFASCVLNLCSMLIFLQKRIRSFVYAFRGIGLLFRTQGNAQVHAVAVLVIAAMGFWLHLAAWEWCAIIGCMALVLATEAINTALELLTDLVSPDYHPLAGKAKDVAAAAVLLSVLLCGIIWGIIFLPKIFA